MQTPSRPATIPAALTLAFASMLALPDLGCGPTDTGDLAGDYPGTQEAGPGGDDETDWPTSSGGSADDSDAGADGVDSGAGGTAATGADAGASVGGKSNTGGASAGGTGGAPPKPPMDCSGIAKTAGFELCGSGPDYCDGVFTNGAGCVAFCAAAGLKCASRYGGSESCGGPELNNPLDCAANTGNMSDWCHCQGAASGGTGGTGGTAGAGGTGGGTLQCPTQAGNPPVQKELDKDDAVYTQRYNWVVTCSPHAYTGQSAEHQTCDSSFKPDGTRKGKATFTFTGVPAGAYDVLIESKHSANRNKAGALFYVNGHAAKINQVGSSAYIWDLHGRYCLSGTVTVVLDSTVNTGSDAVSRVRLKPAS
ncbi:MAG: hypothetical protein HYZ29_22265 [Myxococcales bacterium]|nr:hypothetical protein [Myxococcales bacterium]